MDVRSLVAQTLTRTIYSFGCDDVVRKLNALGVAQGDALMVHASWRSGNGFRGKPIDMIEALKKAVGYDGLLVMPSLTYQNKSSGQFLASGTPMNVRCSPSKMGLLSEVFRRMPGVARSLSPTHPLLAWGAAATEFLAGHEAALVPFGSYSPFAKFFHADGKILLIDTAFSSVTFTHFVEDRIKESLPVELLEATPMTGTVIDYEGASRQVPVQVLSQAANHLRREERLVAELMRNRSIRKVRLGRTRMVVIGCSAIVRCAESMVARGVSFFDAPAVL